MDNVRFSDLLWPLLTVFGLALVFGMSVRGVANFGVIAVVVWCIIAAIIVGIATSSRLREGIEKELFEKFDKETQDDSDEFEEDKELREFIYLDSLSVQSLLASLTTGISEQAIEVTEQTEQVQRRAGLNAGISQGPANLKGNINISETETGTDILETSKRITDQHIFDELYELLDSRGEITSLPDDWDNTPDSYNIDSDDLDVVKIKGEGKTDPVYRMANVLSLISRIEILSEYGDQNITSQADNSTDDMDLSETIEDLKDVVFADQIGVEFEVDDSISYVASVDTDNLWVDDPRREFADSRTYTVLGRVVGEIPNEERWDYIDILRIGSTFLDSDSMDSIRAVVSQFIDMIDRLSERIPLPDMESIAIDDMQGDGAVPKEDSDFKMNIEDKKIYVEGPGLIIDPIAIYW